MSNKEPQDFIREEQSSESSEGLKPSKQSHRPVNSSVPGRWECSCGGTYSGIEAFSYHVNGARLTFDTYEVGALRTAVYPGQGHTCPTCSTPVGLAYIALGLGEAGEVQGKIKKLMRDAGGVMTDEIRSKIVDEAGDLLWYLAGLAHEINVPLAEIASRNLAKLADRAERGVLKGDGDKR